MTTRLISYANARRWLGVLIATVLLASGLIGAHWWPHIANAATNLTTPNPVTAAWEKAQAAGSYHFTSDVMQKIIPVASLTNVGRSSRSDALYLEGQNDLHAQSMELTLWSQGGSVLNAESGVSLRTEGGKTFTRRGTEAWQTSDNITQGFAPQGDFLGYLASIRNVSAGMNETRNGVNYTRYTFEIDGPAFANYMHKQMLAAMRANGELPAGIELERPVYYQNMTGSGELWIGENGLPLRQILDLRFPAQHDERVEAAITVNFSNYGAVQTSLLALLPAGDWQGAWRVLANHIPDLTGLWLGLSLSGAALIVIRYRRARPLQTALVSAVIFSQVAGPLLSTFTQIQFFDTQTVKAATQEEQQAAAQGERDLRTAVQAPTEFDPHQNQLQAVNSNQWSVVSEPWEASAQSPIASLQSSPVAQTTDPGTDTDRDTLTDFTELRIGTSKVISDTDDDGLLDNLEVNGFNFGGQTWYTNPDVTDSNNDGLSDVVEWGINSSTGLPQAAPRNTDGDTLPDLFDPDNDNDGVPDRVDAAPFATGGAIYSEASPLQLTVTNLTPNVPTFVEFQIRPQDPKNLWFAHNVLDWPQDSEGQVRDIDGKTYADVAVGRATDASETNGDMKVVPMLEIRIPNSSANLPSQAELTPFNITVSNFTADGATKVAYVPLAVVTDGLTGERVAFSGQMRYKPTGSWTTPHSVRLAWVVQALNDLPCDPKAATAAAESCQSDGYIHNQPILLHSYYDSWTLTALGVREEHGASMAIFYEDPAVDTNKKDDAALWALTIALDEHFLVGRDLNRNGVRDLKLSDLPTRFDRDNNPSDAQRMSVPNILQVVTNNYTTSDEAAVATAMTETVKILETSFKATVTADNTVKPLLLFAQESSLRALSLDQVAAGEGYATQNGAVLSFNLAPTANTALPVTVSASLKWMGYCGATGNSVTWRPCTSDEYASEIEKRYATLPALPDDTSPNQVPGRMMLALSYYFTLSGGYHTQVQEGSAMLSSRYTLEGESETASRLRAGLNSPAPVTQLVLQSLIHIVIAAKAVDRSILDLPGQIKLTLNGLGKTYMDERKKLAALEFDEEGNRIQRSLKEIKKMPLPIASKAPIHFTRYAGAAIVGGALMVLTTVLSHSPDLDITSRALLGAIGTAIAIGITIYIPAATASIIYKVKVGDTGTAGAKTTFGKVLTQSYVTTTRMNIAFGVGLLFSFAAIWGFFGYAASQSGASATSPEFRKGVAEAVASTLVAILLAVLSATFIGTIIAGIIGVIDAIMSLICELGVYALRNAPGLGGACFTLTTSITKALTYFLYNYEPMIDTSRSDLMVTGAPDLTLADASKGYVPANTLTLSMPITTTVVHKDPDPAQGVLINGYLYLYSPDNIRSSTFKYGLSQSTATFPLDLNQMTGAWQGVTEDHKYVLTPMYRGVAKTDPAPLSGIPLVQGINSTVPFSLTMNFAVPAYECWMMWIPGTPIVFPVCYVREFESNTTTPLTTIKYDVFPNTLTTFLALGNKAGGGLGQSWDARFPALHDADGDGLLGLSYNGLDPNDNTWDTDSDGLSDRFELNRRTAGVAYSPIQRDTDGDGLTDGQEAQSSTDPLIADTDNDGLSDGVEIRHQVADANGKLTAAWSGGWQVTINSTPARTVWVSSNPFVADTDNDGVTDQAEKDLAANPTLRLDAQGVPYHPTVPNTPPLAVFTNSSALAGYIGPNQKLYYTSTVVANVPVAPGVLDVSVPASQNFTPAPLVLPFNPLTFSGSQTVTQAINFTALPVGANGTLDLQSTARTRLQSSTGNAWVADPIASGAALSGFTPPLTARSSALTAARADRPDSYLLNSVTINNNNSLFGDVRGYNLLTGANTVLASSALVNNTSYFPRSFAGTDLAANALGTNLAVWDRRDYCRTLTINSLRVVTAGSDTNGGIEPFITIVTNDRTTSEQIWYWDAAGGAPDMTPGQQRGPNAGGFPLTRTLCGATDVQVWESDGPVNIPAQNQLVYSWSPTIGTGYNNFNAIFEGAGHRIDLNVTIPQKDFFTVGGARLNGDGAVQAPLIFPRPAISATAQLQLFNPVVASDGDGFVALYEATINRLSGRPTQRYLVAQAFDKNGTAGANSFRLVATPDFASNFPSTVYDLAWMGDRYRVVWKAINGATIAFGDINSSGAFQGTGWTTLVTDASTATIPALQPPYTPQIAAEPRGGSERWILTYNRGTSVDSVLLLYPNRTSTTPSMNRVFPNVALQSVVAYNPINRGWLVGWYNTPNLVVYPYTNDLTPITGAGTPFSLATGSSYASNALACPLPQALPTAEFRFEALPTAGTTLTSFSDSSAPSGLPSNTATCTGTECPIPGAAGAPNAPLSDYALQFDGVNDRLSFGSNTVGDIFTVALWLKAAPNANADVYLFSNTNRQNTFWNLGLKNVIPQLMAPGMTPLAGSARIDDNNWHHVVGTFNFRTATAALYVDGAAVANRTASLSSTTISSVFMIGAAFNGSNAFKGTLDHVQLFGTDLAASTVAALYNRTLQSYCVASGAGTNGADIRWGKLTVRENDLRGGRLTASGGLKVIVDNELPTAAFTALSNNAVVGPDQVIGGSASDNGVGVSKVEVSINNGAWQLANGANTWSFSLAGLSGAVGLRVRATDAVGNVGNPSATVNVIVDATAPTVTINAPVGTLKPTKNAAGRWQVPISGTVTDSNGLKAGSLLVRLTQTSGVGVAQSQQAATITGNNWSLNYLLDPSLFDPTGSYTVTAQVDDRVDNRSAAAQVVRLDATGPVATLSTGDATREVISQTITIGGVISDSNSIVGIDKLEIAFTPVEQIAALPGNITTSAAEALLNRVWLPVTLVQRGAGVASTTWSVAIPAGLENIYQIDLRGTDLLGNVSLSAGLWRGMIDTLDPRVVMTTAATGATYTDTADNTQHYEVRFLCAVQDRNLDESRFVCPGEGLAEPVRSFENNAALQTLFPDLTIRSGLAISYTSWTTTATPAATMSACDGFGRCATASTSAAIASKAVDSGTVTAAAAPGAPLAVIVNPTAGSFVAASTGVSVTVAAEAGALLKEVTIKLDNVVVQTLSFAQNENATRILRTIHVPVANEGAHTLVAQATAWDNATQTTLFPVTFTLDQNAPTVTIDASALTVADTWQAQSGILRFNGTASDSVGLAAVQIREGDNDFVDTTFGNGTWQVALPVPDPEGRTLTITVRAIDRAGRISATTQAITTVLSAADAPDTTISSGPSNPSNDNMATFVFAGSASAVAFDCQLDDGAYTPCSSPTVYTNLSKGSHTFRVRAIDSRGLPDLSPAEQSWTVNASALDVTLSTTPSNPTTSRSAVFAFTGNGSSLECRLDDAAFTACTSPQSYSGLTNGDHTFEVRARSGDTVGAATRSVWTVNNAAPVANDQTVTTNQDTALAITLVANDEDALTYKVGTPAHGVLLGIPPALTYSPNTGYSGPDSFTFTAHDGLVESNVATVNITVQTVTQPTPTTTPVTPVETPTATATTTPGVPIETPTATSTNTPVVPVETPTATATTTPVAPTATATPSGTLIGTCGVYTVYKNGNTYTAAGWTGAIKVGTSSNNTLTGGSGRDLMLGLGGNDKLDGKAGDDVLCGGDGVDQVLGVAGNDYLDGGIGNDVLNGGSGDYDDLLAGDGNDTLLDGDGVKSAQGGVGNDLFTLAVRNGWRDANGQPRFTGVAGGYGNDTVVLAILNLTRFFVDITGDERDDPPSPLEGANDSLALAGVIDPASTIIKFERRLVLSAEAEANIPGEEAGAEYLTEPVGDDSEVMPEAPSPVEVTTQLFLPLVTIDGTSSSESVAPIEATPLITETTSITPTVTVTTTSTAPIDTLDAAAPVIQLYLPLVAAQ